MVVMEEFKLKQTREHRDAMARVSQRRIEKITEGKITIRYYLNTDLKPKFSDLGEKVYPLYFRLTVKRQATRGRSLVRNMSLITENCFNDIEKIINFHSLAEFTNEPNEITKSQSYKLYENWIMPILIEKNLIHTIVENLDPFDKSNFDIKSVIEKFENYNSSVKNLINNTLKGFLKTTLEDIKDDNIPTADLYLRSLDWTNGNAYDLWFLIKDISPKFSKLMDALDIGFQVVAHDNINQLSDDELMAINDIANTSLGDLMFKMKFKIRDKNVFYQSDIYSSILGKIFVLAQPI